MAPTKTVQNIIKASRMLEASGNDILARDAFRMVREVRAEIDMDAELESWDKFSDWWKKNGSKTVLFSLSDKLGDDHPAVSKLKEILSAQDKLEDELHEVYVTLKNKGSNPGVPFEDSTPPKEESTEMSMETSSTTPEASEKETSTPAPESSDLDDLEQSKLSSLSRSFNVLRRL
jgi:hypothetical protein